ncbi:MAG: HAMP domain-containing sensor histidine kinase [Pseudomonadota bacterium]
MADRNVTDKTSCPARRQAESRLRHEILQPIAAMRMVADVLKSEGQPDVRSKAVRALNGSLDQVEKAVTAIIDYQSLSSGTITPFVQDIEISELIASRLEAFENSATVAGVTLRSIGPVQEIKTDPGLLSICIDAFLENAIDFTEIGSVDILIKDLRAGVEITVRDTGVGLDGLDTEALWAPYAIARTERARRVTRLGLGLARAEAAASLIEADVFLRSRPDASGAEASIILPKT